MREAFASYIRAQVAANDVVIITSAPPTTLFLHRAIRARGASGVYWLQDYYPQLIRGVWDAPEWLRRLLDRLWTRELRAWPRVVKAAGNLGYSGPNALVIRNWNTARAGRARAGSAPHGALLRQPRLGTRPRLPSSSCVRRCTRRAMQITVRGDGPGMARLPGWIRSAPPLEDPAELVRSYWAAEVHLVAGHPRFPDAVFPSKFWNARATGRPVLASGFTGVMAEELAAALHVGLSDAPPAVDAPGDLRPGGVCARPAPGRAGARCALSSMPGSTSCRRGCCCCCCACRACRPL